MILHACLMTEDGQRVLALKENQQVTVINSQSQDDKNEELPEEEMIERKQGSSEKNCVSERLVIGQLHSKMTKQLRLP